MTDRLMFVRIPERSNLSKEEVEFRSATDKETLYFDEPRRLITLYFDEPRRLIWVAGIPYGREYDPERELYVDEELEGFVDEELEGFVDENFDSKAVYRDDPTEPASIMSDSSSFFS